MSTCNEKIQKYKNELQQYAKDVGIPFELYLENNRAPYKPFLKYLYDYYLFMSYLVDKGLIPNDNINVAFRVLFAKGALSLFGVYSSLQNGLITEAPNSLRSLFEVYVNTKLILQSDTLNRLKLFENFERVEQWNNLKANQNLSQEVFDKTFDTKRIQNIQSDYNSVKKDYHPQMPHHWAWKIYSTVLPKHKNPNLRFIADQLGLSFDYVKVYNPTSVAIHGSAILANILVTDQSVSLVPKFTRSIYNQGYLALDYAAKLTVLLVEYFNFLDPNDIKSYIDSFVLQAYEETNKR